MSWYLFNNSPERELRGKKVDTYQNMNRPKVILDWGLGQLSPKKRPLTIRETIQQPTRNAKSLHQQNKIPARNQEKAKLIHQTINVLTESSDQEGKQELINALNNYSKKKDKQVYSNSRQAYLHTPSMILNNQSVNKSLNVLNPIGFETEGIYRSSKNINMDSQTAKRMRFLQKSLLPQNKRDNMSAVLDYQLNEKVGSSLSDSRLSGKSKLGNKVVIEQAQKNDSDVQLGNGYNSFAPLKQKVKDMNQKLKEMYKYDQWCKKRQTSQINFG